MFLYTIGFTKKTAQKFFERIKFYHINLLVDIRLNNKSQLAGFSKGGAGNFDYLLKKICDCDYEHKKEYAPTQEILKDYKQEKITWQEYEEKYTALMIKRNSVNDFLTCFDGIYESVCLLCAEPTPEHCHRRLFAEMITSARPEIELMHL